MATYTERGYEWATRVFDTQQTIYLAFVARRKLYRCLVH